MPPRHLLRAFVPATLAVVVAASVAVLPAAADGPPVGGLAFRDVDHDGVQGSAESGEPGVTVTVADATGATMTTTTDADGEWTLDPTALDAGPFRVTFSGWGDHLQPGPLPEDATDGTVRNGTTMQLVDGGDDRVDLGLHNPAHWCDATPEIATTCFLGGSATIDGTTVLSLPYDDGTESTTSNDGVADIDYVSHALQSETGPVRGLAHDRASDTLFAGAHVKRMTAFPGGPDDDGPDRIWLVERDTGSASLFYTAEAGDDPHDYDNLQVDTGAWDAVAKSGWGDVDLSEDASTLYAVNLLTRTIHAIPVERGANGVLSPGTPTIITPPASVAGACADGEWAPGGLETHDGVLYATVTCTAETSQDRTDLHGWVYAVDPDAGTWTAVADVELDYGPRGNVIPVRAPETAASTADQGNWLPWVATPSNASTRSSFVYYPQPWLTDLEVLAGGDMVLGISDRAADQTGNDQNFVAVGGQGVSAGDTLRLPTNGDGTWAPPDSAGDFYGDDRFPLDATPASHNEITLGNVGVLMRSDEVVVSAFDPPPVGGEVRSEDGTTQRSGESFRSGGLVALLNDDGTRQRSQALYLIDEPGSFGKAAGIGDVELVCEAAPIEVGDRVWLDDDGDGVQDPGEDGIEGVTVQLLRDGTVVDTDTTSSDGRYLFTGLDALTDYEVRVPAGQDDATEPLEGLRPTLPDAGGDDASGDDAADSDAVTSPAGETIAVTTGVAGANDHTLDIGYAEAGVLSLGDLVFDDRDDDGVAEDGEDGIGGVVMELFLDTGAAGVDVDTDPRLDVTTTAPDGTYLFEGLQPGDYVVRIAPSSFADGQPLAGYRSSLAGTAPPDPDDDVDDDDNGADLTSSGIVAEVVTLAEGGEPDDDGDTDTDSNLTVDFGVHLPPASLGDLVWRDDDVDGVQDDGEPGVPGAEVTLRRAADPDTVVETATTDDDGRYLLDELPRDGSWVVCFAVPDGWRTSPRDAGDPGAGGDAVDSDASGVGGAGVLGPGQACTDAVDLPGGSSDLTVDLGIWEPASLGDRAWWDLDEDGVQDGAGTDDAGQDGAEPDAAGVVVSLTDCDGGPVLDAGGTPVADVTTGADGSYRFDDLLPGTYCVVFDARPIDAELTEADVAGAEDDAGGATDSDAVETEAGLGTASSVTLEAGDDVPTIDVGLLPGCVEGRVWLDLDRDGIDDVAVDGTVEDGVAAEPGAGGVTATLLDTDGDVVTTTTTADDGTYAFCGLVPAAYTVRFETPDDAVLTLADAGDDDTVDSDADLDTRLAPAVDVTSGDTVPDVDAGLVVPIDVQLAKTLTDDELVAGEDLTWELVVTNDGGYPTSASVVVTDTLPSQLTLVSTEGDGWTCSAQGQTLTCQAGTGLAPGESRTLRVVTRLAEDAEGRVVNSATVSVSEVESVTANNVDSAGGDVQPGSLARTGDHVDRLAWWLMLLIATGLGLVLVGRRGRRSVLDSSGS